MDVEDIVEEMKTALSSADNVDLRQGQFAKIIDTVKTGLAPPGTIYQLRPDEMQVVTGGSPHYIGLSETLALARRLKLPVADNVFILAVECSDCLTIGGEMHPAVRAAISPLLAELQRLLERTHQLLPSLGTPSFKCG